MIAPTHGAAVPPTNHDRPAIRAGWSPRIGFYKPDTQAEKDAGWWHKPRTRNSKPKTPPVTLADLLATL